MLFETADYEGALRTWIGAGAQAIGALTLTLLLLALIGEVFRSLDRLPRLVGLTDCVTPLALRRLVASVIAVGTTLVGAVAPAGAAEAPSARRNQVATTATAAQTTTTLSVRQWLEQQTRTTATPAAPATPNHPFRSDSPPSTAPSQTTSRDGSGLTYSEPATPSDGARPTRTGTGQPGARAAVEPGTRSAQQEPGVAPAGKRYVVRPGDSLWKIARAELGRGASNRSVGVAWHQIYETNREVVGKNPGLIRPGLVLQLPSLQP